MLINKYITKTIIKNTISFTMIMALTVQVAFSIRFIEILVKKYITFGKFMEIMFYTLQQYIMILLPLGIFVATFSTYSNLLKNKELYVLRSIGLSNFSILKPTIKIGFIFMLLSYVMQTTIGPFTWNKFQDIMYFAERNTFLSQVLRPATFNSVNKETTSFIDNVKGLNVSGIFIHQRKKDGSSNVIFAPSGSVIIKDKKTKILINKGIQTNISNGEVDKLKFDRYVFNLKEEKYNKRVREETDDYTSYEILHLMKMDMATQNQKSDFFRRLITPWIVLLMSIFGGLVVISRKMSRIETPLQIIGQYSLGFSVVLTELILYKIAEKNMAFVFYDLIYIIIIAGFIGITIIYKDWYKR